MDDLPQSPANQNIPGKQIALILGIVIYVVISLAVLQLYSWQFGLLMLAPVIFGVIVVVFLVPSEQWKRVGVAKNNSLFGRITNLAEIIAVIYLAAIVLRWLYGRL